jgi:RNA polymerase sigma-70 factor, ECF subfamily
MEKISIQPKVKNYTVANFAEIYTKWHKAAIFFANKYVRNEDVANQVVNDSFVKIYNNLHKFDNTANFKTFLYSYVKNTAIDWLRANKKQVVVYSIDQEFEHLGEDKNLKYDVPTYGLNPEQNLEKEQKISKVRKAINSLADNLRPYAQLYYINEYKLREIAEIMQVPLGTVKGNISRANKKLVFILS